VPPQRVWTNSAFGRILGTVLGVFCLLVPYGDPAPGHRPWHGSEIGVDLGFGLVGLLVIVAFWTSRLTLRDGVLTARNFFVSRSMPLVEVVGAEPAAFPFLGIKIRRADGSGIRTLVSGQSWNEPWTPRATRIAGEIRGLAAKARAGLAVDAPAAGRTDREWTRWQWLGATAAVLVLGVVGLTEGVGAFSQPWGTARLESLGCLGGGLLFMALGVVSALFLRPRRAGSSGRHARQ
jgi:hypothetical protein